LADNNICIWSSSQGVIFLFIFISIDFKYAAVEVELEFKGMFVHVSNQGDQKHDVLYVSTDGYIRLTEKTLDIIPMRHLDSGLFVSDQVHGLKVDVVSELTGYTEWSSQTSPSISIGWDWKLNCFKESRTYEIVGAPFSNLLLQDEFSNDLTVGENLKRISKIINKLDWVDDLKGHISKKYV